MLSKVMKRMQFLLQRLNFAGRKFIENAKNTNRSSKYRNTSFRKFVRRYFACHRNVEKPEQRVVFIYSRFALGDSN